MDIGNSVVLQQVERMRLIQTQRCNVLRIQVGSENLEVRIELVAEGTAATRDETGQ